MYRSLAAEDVKTHRFIVRRSLISTLERGRIARGCKRKLETALGPALDAWLCIALGCA